MTLPLSKQTKRPSKHGKQLTITQKLIIYAEKGSGKSSEKIADEYQVAKSTVLRLWKDEGLAAMKDQVALAKETMADQLALTAGKCIDQVGNVIHKASAKDAAISAGIMIDKMRLLNDKSTQNIGVHTFLDLCNQTPVLDDDEE